MNSLIRHIEYLASRHDCVIIPGLGAVLAHYKCAGIDCVTFKILPPTRAFAFNPALKQSDGLLACSVARAEKVSYEAAQAIINEKAAAMCRQLNAQGELSLGRLGVLTLSEGASAPEFTSFASPSASALTCMLPSFDLSPKAEEKPQAPEITVPHYSHFGRFARIAASIALLLGICFVASTPISIDEAALASLSPHVQKAPVEEIIPTLPAEPETPAAVLRIIGSNQAVEEVIEQEGNYLMIVGSFTSVDEAKRFIERYNPEWKILLADGRIRVYCKSFQTQGEAYATVARETDTYKDAWIYTRK